MQINARTLAWPFWLALLLLCLVCPLHSAEVPPGFRVDTLVTNINAATALTILPDGRVLYAEQTGAIRMWKDNRLLPEPVLDLSDRVDDFWERGLIGLTFEPGLPHNLFVVYVAKAPYTHHVVSRFTMSGDTIDPSSEVILLEGDDQATLGGHVPAGHQGGPICFGADGKLYIGLGEQTNGKASQELNTLQGKILRINKDGSIPEDNPFYHQTAGKYRAIWAYGIRNPFGLVVEPGTGRLWDTEVGDSGYEEVNIIQRGGNYGWPKAEGPSSDPAYVSPVYAYPHAIGRSICGGVFYPRTVLSPEGFPEKWRGRFFFCDWSVHWIKALDPTAPTNVLTFARNLNGPVALQIAPDGSLFVLNRGTIWRDGQKFVMNSGSLLRIHWTGDVQLPTKAEFPARLSETPWVKTTVPFQPDEEFVACRLNAPPWIPGLEVDRYIFLTPHQTIRFSPDDEWGFPPGTVVLQHYQLQEQSSRPFETHILLFKGPRTVAAAAYRWNQRADQATLIEDGEIVPVPGQRNRFWYSPGPETELDLDTVITGFHCHLNTRQLNRSVPHPSTGQPVNQLQLWNERGWFHPPLSAKDIPAFPKLAALEDVSAPADVRVRSYLDVHCATCHRPSGLARGQFDARFQTPLSAAGIVRGQLMAGDLGIAGAQVVVPGHPEKSILLQRLKRTDFFRMPPIALNEPPPALLPLVKEWIHSLPTGN